MICLNTFNEPLNFLNDLCSQEISNAEAEIILFMSWGEKRDT